MRWIVGGEAHKDGHSHITGYVAHHCALQEDIDHGGQDKSDECHEEHLAQRCEVGLGDAAHHGHHGEGAGSDEEHTGDGCQGVGHEDGRHGDAVEHGIEREHKGGHGHGQAVDGGGEPQHEAQLTDYQAPEEQPVGEHGRYPSRTVGYHKSGKAGDYQRQGHPYVHLAHQGRIGHRGCLLSLVNHFVKSFFFDHSCLFVLKIYLFRS